MTEKLKAQISQLEQAATRLDEALKLKPTQINKDASIQRFEFTFELAWKIMQSFAFEKGIEVVSPKDSLRTAAELGLVEDLDLWFDFLDARNTSSHIYNEKMANLVYGQAKRFLPQVQRLVEKIKSQTV